MGIEPWKIFVFEPVNQGGAGLHREGSFPSPLPSPLGEGEWFGGSAENKDFGGPNGCPQKRSRTAGPHSGTRSANERLPMKGA